MDPEARRFMWKVIADTMSGRSVILTTHSMEEAEALSHKIGIMVGGRLRCIGTNQHLKDKFGKGYSLDIRAPPAKNAEIQTWISEIFPQANLDENLGEQLRYEIPMEGLQLSTAWANVEKGKNDHGITEYAISQTTLEQVFVRFAAQQEEETGMDAASLAAAVRTTIPNCWDLLCCKPQQNYEWNVPIKGQNGEVSGHVNVKVDFAHRACLCCKQNPGIVTANGVPVKRLDEDGFETDEDLILLDKTNPGCRDGSCCGCNSCCGFNSCFCCRKTHQVFRHSGMIFEVIDYNEIPGTSRARPCFLMVDGKEASTGIPRSGYMSTLFEQGGKKYCCMVGIPLGLLWIICLMVVRTASAVPVILVTPFLIWFCVWCICGNWCGRSSHYTQTHDLMYAGVPTAPSAITLNQTSNEGPATTLKSPTAQTYGATSGDPSIRV
jgi:hypothetical protein